eukprot:9316827-Prorocentrum_lima.AAC.1
MLIKRGCFKDLIEEKPVGPRFPRSATKFSELSVSALSGLLKAMEPGMKSQCALFRKAQGLDRL